MSEVLTLDRQSEVIEQKRSAWGQMGVVVYKQELQLQVEAQATIKSINYPTKIEDIPGAEQKLKELKAAQKTIESKRKEITSRFDDVVKRLMEPEKSFTEPINNLSAKIIEIKKEYEAEQKRKQSIIDEASAIRLYYQNESVRVKAELQAKVNSLVSRCYEKALQDDTIDPDNVEAYINASKEAIKRHNFSFTIKSRDVIFSDNSTIDLACFNDAMNIDIDSFVNDFKNQIDFKFSDFEISFNNKVAALAESKRQEELKQKEIEDKKRSEELAAKLAATATPVDATLVFTKALKKSYEVDMPETIESVLSIMAAFTANIDKCLPKLKVNKWFAFTPAQAANVLGKLKSENNAFAPTGITFKEVEKL